MRRLGITFLLLCIACLSGCGSSWGLSEAPEEPVAAPEEEEEPDSILVRQDEEGLVSVRIEDGKAEVLFDLDRWETLYNISDRIDTSFYDPDLLREGPFRIEGLSGRVRDACIGKVKMLDHKHYENFTVPSVVLLMEDGTLEYFLADPYIGDYEWVFYSQGRLPWLKDIVSLAYGQDGDGFGDMTIFAWDSQGMLFDIRRVVGADSGLA